jgi:hypothetical protein
MDWLEKQKEFVLDQKAKVVKFYQRGRYGVSYHDEFSLDYYLSRILIQSLPKYKNDGEYGEFVVFTDPDAQVDWSEDADEAADLAARELWDMKIDAIWSALYDHYESDDPEDFYLNTERIPDAMEVFAPMYWCLWW